jgi:hypothetical protein
MQEFDVSRIQSACPSDIGPEWATALKPDDRKEAEVRTSQRGVALLAGVGLLAVSGLAAAQETPEDVPEETTFNFGYDEENHVFLWNTSDTNSGLDCDLENGALWAVYNTDGDGIVADDLTEGEGGPTVVFPDHLDPSIPGAPYTVDGECGLQGDEIAGPNGQINHGQFMKYWNSIYEGRGRGCINRFLAQSDLGKGDQQIRVSDVDPAFESVVTGDGGEITFETALADCERDRGNGNANPNASFNREADGEPGAGGNGNANPNASFNRDTETQGEVEHGNGRPESPGRSGDAPGHNKD